MDPVIVYDVPHLIYWDWRIAMDLFLGGIGAGAFLVAAVVGLVYRDRYARVCKVGAVLSPVCVAVGLCFLLSEMGHPFRIHYTLTRFNPRAVLAWGGPLQGLFLAVGVVHAFLWVKPGRERLRTRLAGVGLPLAILVGGYHGVLLAVVAARPLWNTGLATATAITGFLTTGMAAVLLVTCLLPASRRRGAGEGAPAASGNEPVLTPRFGPLLLAGLVLHGLLLCTWWGSLWYGPAAGRAALAAASAALGPLFWGVTVVIGLVIPVLLQAAAIIRRPRTAGRLNAPLAVLTAVLVLIGGFVFRYAVVVGGQLS